MVFAVALACKPDDPPSVAGIRDPEPAPPHVCEPPEPAAHGLPASCSADRPVGPPWEPLGFPHGRVVGVAADPDPEHADVVYLATTTGLFWSPDRGASWCALPFPDRPFWATSFALLPTQPPTVLLGGHDGTVRRTTDDGATWEALAVASDPVGTLAGTPDGQLLLAHVLDPTYPGQGHLHRSVDAGATWQPQDERTWEHMDLAWDPTDCGVVYRGGWGDTLYRSTDSGATWSELDAYRRAVGALELDSLAVATDGTVYTRERGWVHVGTNGGEDWAEEKLTTFIDFGRIAVDPRDPRAIAVLLRAAVYTSTDAGATWATSDAVAPWDDAWPTGLAWTGGELLAWVADDLARSRSGAWSRSGAMATGFPAVVDGDVALAAAYGRVYRSDDAGETFPSVAEVDAGRMVVAPSDHDRVYATVAMWPSASILRSDDQGVTWASVPVDDAAQIAVSADDPDHLWVSGAPMWESHDGGATWSATALAGAPLADPLVGDRVYADGARSDDGGATWTPIALSDADLAVTADGRLWACPQPGFTGTPEDATTTWPDAEGPGLYVSDDAGATFDRVPQPTAGDGWCLLVDPPAPVPVVALYSQEAMTNFVLADERWPPVALHGVYVFLAGMTVDLADPSTVVADTELGPVRIRP